MTRGRGGSGAEVSVNHEINEKCSCDRSVLATTHVNCVLLL